VRRLLFLCATLVALLAGTLALMWWALPDPSPLASRNPSTTALIEQRKAEARARRRPFRPHQAWMPLERISPRLVQAVLVSEDASFFAHGPFDWHEMRAAAGEGLRSRRTLRGASTVTQQLAKNLWLGTERTVWRKVKEGVLAVKLERELPKRRILALYLNVAEWGDGIFGAEAAARARFGVSAAELTTAQAALLAAMLPAPRRVDLDHPSRWLARRAYRVLDRLREVRRVDADEHARAGAELERLLSGASGQDEEPFDDPAVG
jgi:monofunctional biosynthetic peptidoglycan transglycosylase